MKRKFKQLTGICVALCMLIGLLPAAGVLAAEPVTNLWSDFEGYSDIDAFIGANNAIKSVKYNGEWQSEFDFEATTDISGNNTTALHMHWDKPESVTAADMGSDAIVAFSNIDYSGKAITSFDVKLDSSISSFRANNRIRVTKDDTTATKYVNLIQVNAGSMSVLGNVIEEGVEVGEWNHFTLVTSYDETTSAVTGSMWMNGVKKASNVTQSFDGTVQIDATTGQNRLVLQSNYNAKATDDLKPGVWIDNVIFGQSDDGYFWTNPENRAYFDGNVAEFVYPADIAPETFDADSVKVLKNGIAVEDSYAELLYNKVKVTLSENGTEPGCEYTVALPKDMKNILGNNLASEARTLSFITAEAFDGSVSVISPADSSIVESGKAITLVATAAKDSAVSFYADGALIGEATSDKNGIASTSWTPENFGTAVITARVADNSSEPVVVDVYEATDLNVSWSAGNGSMTIGNEYEGYNSVIAVTGNSGQAGYLNKGGMNYTDEIMVFNLDMYVDADGNGGLLTLRGKDADGVTTSFNRLIRIISGTAQIGAEDYTDHGIAPVKSAWNNVRIILDIDSQTFDAYLNGRQLVADHALAIDILTVTNPRIQNTTKGTTIYYANATISTLTEKMVNYGAEIDTALNGALLEKNEPVVLKASGIGGEATAARFYADGVKLGDGIPGDDGEFTFTYTPDSQGEKSVCAVVAIDGTDYTTSQISFKVLGNASSVNSTRSITVQDGTVSDEGATDTSVALTVGSRNGSGNQPYTAVGNTKITTGYVATECDITFSNGAGVAISNRNSGTNYTQKAVEFNSGKIYYYNGTSSVDSGYTYSYDTPYNIRTLWNLQELTIDIYINGELMPFKTTMRADWSNVNSIRHTALSTKGQEFVIQNECVRIIPIAPELVGISVVDTNGNVLNNAEMKAEAIGAINVSYSLAIDSGSLTDANFALYRGFGSDTKVPVSLALSGDGKTVIITPDASSMEDAASYRLEISADVKSGSVASGTAESYTFRTIALGRGVKNAIFTLGNSELKALNGVETGSKITFSTDVVDNISEKVWIIAAVYGVDGNERTLKDVNVVRTNIPDVSGATNYTCELEITKAIEEGDILCGFVWTDELVAYGDEYCISYSGN